MSTSGQITGLLTAGQYVTLALELLGQCAPGDEPSGEELSSGVRYLNFMLKSWQADGCNLFRDEEVTIEWPAGQADCELAPNVIDVIMARYVQSSTYERWLDRWERWDYQQLPNKISTGLPTIYNFVKTVGNPRMRVWPVPSSTITIRANIARVIEDVTAADQEIDLPQEWTECAYYNLAARMANTMGAFKVGPQVVIDVNQKAGDLYAALSTFDRPGSVFFKRYC